MRGQRGVSLDALVGIGVQKSFKLAEKVALMKKHSLSFHRWLKSSMPTPEISHLTKQSNFALIFTPKNIEFQGISSDISGFTEHQNCRSSPVTKLDKTQLCTDDNYPSGNYRQSRPVLMRLKVYLRGVSPDHLFMLFRSPEQATTYQTADLANDDRSLWEKN